MCTCSEGACGSAVLGWLFGPRAAERTCSEDPSPISLWLCGGGAGGAFGNLGAAHSLSLTQSPSSVVRPPSLTFSISPSSSNVSSLNIDRRVRIIRRLIQ